MIPFPNKKYQIIYADPPWKYDSARALTPNSCISGELQKPYSYMPIDDICKLPIKNLTDKDCLLFMWVTAPKLNISFQVFSAWGFEYSTVAFVWEKLRVNPGYYTLSSCEFVLVGRKGNIPKPRGIRNIKQFYQEERTVHSKKPNGIRDLIHKMFPTQIKIELFARQKTEGWDVWGNEV
jgi:N6-adenosine-specific RNA methylase IME4